MPSTTAPQVTPRESVPQIRWYVDSSVNSAATSAGSISERVAGFW
ncbi:hypothetical protein [Streptomyces avidinii]